jgi:hypothetical protein
MDAKAPPPSSTAIEVFGQRVAPKKPYESDQLPELREEKLLLLNLPARVVAPALLVFDANRVLRSISAKAQYPSVEMRTPLEEAVAAGVIKAHAPTFLLQEVDDEHLSRFARPSRPLSRLQEARERLLKSIRLTEAPNISSPSIERLRAADPKDVPYAQLLEHLKLDAIVSHDSHWKVTDYRILAAEDHDIIKTLRDYARAVTEEIGRLNLLVGGGVLGVAAAKGMYDLVRRLPPVVQIALAAAAILGVAHPKSRQLLVEVGLKALEPLMEFGAKLHEKSLVREKTEHLIRRDIQPNPHRLTLREHALRVLLESKGPLELSELECRVRAAGAKTRAKNLGPYLRRQMAADQENFVEYLDGRWEARAQLIWSPRELPLEMTVLSRATSSPPAGR